ncbi:peptidase S1 [uncultured Maricaulis sp.]|uniref:peptidase S1 n=1 Tax=uncultured Maricaulis sp. TaxID=174710 RepID=UPI0026355374|nr:peptidase S1 [uncultured Maricaulis sp.]
MNRPPYSALLSAVALALAVGGGAVLAVGDEAGDNLYLSAGFTPDPRTVDLVLDARIDASAVIAPDCHGFIASERPDVAVYYNAGPFPLILSARAEEDMMLIVNAPDGQWYCDDDSGSGLNPSIRFGEPASGNYDIWVGRHVGPGPATARLSISELYSE